MMDTERGGTHEDSKLMSHRSKKDAEINISEVSDDWQMQKEKENKEGKDKENNNDEDNQEEEQANKEFDFTSNTENV